MTLTSHAYIIHSNAPLVLVDFPDTAKFLTLEERAFVVHKKSKYKLKSTRANVLIARFSEYDNSSVGEEEHFKARHVTQAMTDWQVWLHILIYMSIVGPRKCS